MESVLKNLSPDGDDTRSLTGEWRRYFLLPASFDGLRNDGFPSELSGDLHCIFESIT